MAKDAHGSGRAGMAVAFRSDSSIHVGNDVVATEGSGHVRMGCCHLLALDLKGDAV